MSHGFPCLMFPISRCISSWTDRCFPPIQTTRCGRTRFRSIFRWIHSPKFHGCMIVWWGNAKPPTLFRTNISLTYPYQPALLSRIIFPFVQVGYVRFLPWRVSSGQAKAPRSYPIRFHARHASHAHQQKENTQQIKELHDFPSFFGENPPESLTFMNHFNFSLPPVQEGIGIWCWSSNAGEGGL